MRIETYKCLTSEDGDRSEFMAFKFELHAALSLVGFQNNNRPFAEAIRLLPKRSLSYRKWPVVVLKADQ